MESPTKEGDSPVWKKLVVVLGAEQVGRGT